MVACHGERHNRHVRRHVAELMEGDFTPGFLHVEASVERVIGGTGSGARDPIRRRCHGTELSVRKRTEGCVTATSLIPFLARHRTGRSPETALLIKEKTVLCHFHFLRLRSE